MNRRNLMRNMKSNTDGLDLKSCFPSAGEAERGSRTGKKGKYGLFPLILSGLLAGKFKPGSLAGIIFHLIVSGLLLIPACQCSALPVWPVTADPNSQAVSEDRIGYEDNSYLEFLDYDPNSFSDPNLAVMEYHVGDPWLAFPHRLNAKNRPLHALHLWFDTNNTSSSINLILAAKTDPGAAPQYLGILYDGHPIHRPGGEEVPGDAFSPHTFWLGNISMGSHSITITNESDPNSPYGLFIDYLKLVQAPRDTHLISGEHQTVSTGMISMAIQEATPGDTIVIMEGVYQESDFFLKSGLTLRSAHTNDPDQIDPGAVTIEGATMHGAYQATIRGLTIKSKGYVAGPAQVDPDLALVADRDFMSLSNNIILSGQIGILLTGQELELLNNTIIAGDCGVYIQRAHEDDPLPGLTCRNNIFSDANCAVYLLSDSNNPCSLDPGDWDSVIHEFSFNNSSTSNLSNVSLQVFGQGNMRCNPWFMDPHLDNYRLETFSPCIDAGHPESDFSHEPDPNGGRINLGAYGNTLKAQPTKDTDTDGVPDYEEGPGDVNQNGLADWQDDLVAVFATATGQGFESERGFGVIAVSLEADGNTPLLLRADGKAPLPLRKVTAMSRNDLTASGISPPDLHFYYGFWKFEVEELAEGSTKVKIVIHSPEEPFSGLQRYYVYHPESGWLARPVQSDQSRVTVTMEYPDLVSSPDGSLVHIGGMAVPYSLENQYRFKGCFLSTL